MPMVAIAKMPGEMTTMQTADIVVIACTCSSEVISAEKQATFPGRCKLDASSSSAALAASNLL